MSAPVAAAPGFDAAQQPAAPQPHGTYIGTGRRKTAVARVRIRVGTGKILINRRAAESYFPELRDREAVIAPLRATNALGRWDVSANVRGGGPTGQAGAVLLGVARALVRADKSYEPSLRDAGLLTRDAREVERKKYGHRKARRSFQFSKR